jgi:pyridoxamine 5'-phosphate oxidase family protein
MKEEDEFLRHARLARMATISKDGMPHVIPVGFDFDGAYLYVSGQDFEKTLKFRNLQQNSNVALVVDELVSVDPWRVRGLEVRGTAELIRDRGRTFSWGVGRPYARITPMSKAIWGL